MTDSSATAQPTSLEAAMTLYNRLMASMYPLRDFSRGRFVVRQWDDGDGCWTDCTEACSGEEALVYWLERTAGGTRCATPPTGGSGIYDYYCIFPAETRMYWNGDEGREMFRQGDDDG